ncbi:MAG: hypothetical protein H6745_13975 [Deltaproteobacteria bacterium]|nr:hypothetical protein [Deltaproteobacteria bacterium]
MSPSYHAKADRQPADRGLALIGALLFANTVALALVGLVVPPDVAGCGFEKAILCAEMPPSGSALTALLMAAPNTLAQWRLSIWLDMPFLLLYGALLAGSARSLAAAPGWLVRVAVAGAVAGVLFDVAENIGILVAAHEPRVVTDGLASLIDSFAHAKFALLGVSCAALAGLALSKRREGPWEAVLVIVGGFVALVCGLVGLAMPRVVEVGALGIAVACAGLWWRAIRRAFPRSREESSLP